MKRKILVFAVLVAVLSPIAFLNANALPESQVIAIRKAVADVPTLELAPKAAAIVKNARAQDRKEVAVTVVKLILSKKPMLAPGLVGAISKVAPETSAAIAAVAAELSPEQVGAITKAAVSNAPTEAAQIAGAVAKAAPKSAMNIARRIVGIVPDATPEVVEAIVSAVSRVQPLIEANKIIASIEADKTIGMVNIIARLSRSSAARPGSGTIAKKPVVNPPPPPAPVLFPTAEPRSADVVAALQGLNALSTKTDINVSQQSDIIVASVGTINQINKTTTLTKQERNNIIRGAATVIAAIASEDSLQGQGSVKTDLMKVVVTTISNAVADPNTSPEEKTMIANFISTNVTAIINDPQITGGEVVGTLAKVVEKAKQLETIAATTVLSQSDVNSAQADVTALERAYGSTQ